MATLAVGGTTIFDGATLQSGVVFPAGHILQAKCYTYTTTRLSSGGQQWMWVTNDIKGGSTDYITFPSAIISGNHCLLSFTATTSADTTSLKHAKFFIHEGTSTVNSLATGPAVSGMPTDGLANCVFRYSAAAEYGRSKDISFQHQWTPATTTPNISLVVHVESHNASGTVDFYIGKSGYNDYTTPVTTGYQVSIMEIQA